MKKFIISTIAVCFVVLTAFSVSTLAKTLSKDYGQTLTEFEKTTSPEAALGQKNYSITLILNEPYTWRSVHDHDILPIVKNNTNAQKPTITVDGSTLTINVQASLASDPDINISKYIKDNQLIYITSLLPFSYPIMGYFIVRVYLTMDLGTQLYYVGMYYEPYLCRQVWFLATYAYDGLWEKCTPQSGEQYLKTIGRSETIELSILDQGVGSSNSEGSSNGSI